MANTLFIRFWKNVGPNQIQAPMSKISDTTLAIGGETHTSAVTESCLAELSCDVICSIDVGTAAVATTSMTRLPANTFAYFVWLNNGERISVIANS